MKESKYVALYNGKKWKGYAFTLYAAKVKAIKELRVPKSKTGLLVVMLAEDRDGKPIVHLPLF